MYVTRTNVIKTALAALVLLVIVAVAAALSASVHQAAGQYERHHYMLCPPAC